MKIPRWYHDALKVSADIGRRDVFFVIGCQKSGTTWVRRLLDNHPNVCCRGGCPVPDRYLEVRYEDLHDSPTVHTRRMLQFLGVSAADDIVRSCVHRAAFRALSGRDAGNEDPSSHFRKGIVGDWTNRFDEAALRRFEAVAGPLLQELGYARAAPAALARSLACRTQASSLNGRRLRRKRRGKAVAPGACPCHPNR
ncbi:MAG: sulfotransferase domain-containing protein [Planctomycetota bacterium]|jgi:hypothetical protein